MTRRATVDAARVEQAVNGETVALNVREREQVVRQMSAAGLSAKEIAGRIGVQSRTVVRIRNRLRETGALPPR